MTNIEVEQAKNETPCTAHLLAEYGTHEKSYTSPAWFSADSSRVLRVTFLMHDYEHETVIVLPHDSDLTHTGIISGSHYDDGVLKTAAVAMPYPCEVECAFESTWQVFLILNDHLFTAARAAFKAVE